MALSRRGYARTTLTDVAREAGLSPGIVNFYFKSKEQLFIAALEQLGQEYDDFWSAAIAGAGDSPAAALDAMIEADFHPQICTFERVKVWFAFWAEAQIQPSYRELVARFEAASFEQTRGLCLRLIEQGGYRGLDADAVAWGINAMIDGLWFDYLIDPEAFDPEASKRTCRLFLSGLFPREFGRKTAPTLELTGDEGVLGQAAHRSRVSAALRRRLYPNTALQAKDLAAVLGVTPDTARNWLAETSEPSSWMIGRIATALDALVWTEIYGPFFEAMRQRFETRVAATRGAEKREQAALDVINEGGA